MGGAPIIGGSVSRSGRAALALAGLLATLPLQTRRVEAQGADTLPFRTSSAAGIPSPQRDSMPASHRSAVDSVDQPVAVLYCPPPQYPPELAAFGFDGVVDVQFVVDTSGRAELEDLVIKEASHPGFVISVRRAIAKCRYRPAQRAGDPVRQLVQQRVDYHLGPEPQ
jgi:TonB family protein